MRGGELGQENRKMNSEMVSSAAYRGENASDAAESAKKGTSAASLSKNTLAAFSTSRRARQHPRGAAARRPEPGRSAGGKFLRGVRPLVLRD